MTVTVVGIGGSLRADSQSERALHVALSGAEEAGAKTIAVTGTELVLPFYDPAVPERPESARRLIELLREADGVVLVSPGYHGSLSGLVKNALDYIQDLSDDPHPYLDGRAVGCVTSAMGWQAAVSTLTALRSIVHSLRGWPTPLGVPLNTAEVRFDADGTCSDQRAYDSLRLVGRQVAEFALGEVGHHRLH